MKEEWKTTYLKHLERVTKQIEQMKEDLRKKPNDFGNFEHRLYWAVRGVDPFKAVCCKHKQRIIKNDWGEFICGDCMEEFIANEIKEFDENLYFVPDNKPAMMIQGIKYGSS